MQLDVVKYPKIERCEGHVRVCDLTRGDAVDIGIHFAVAQGSPRLSRHSV